MLVTILFNEPLVRLLKCFGFLIFYFVRLLQIYIVLANMGGLHYKTLSTMYNMDSISYMKF